MPNNERNQNSSSTSFAWDNEQFRETGYLQEDPLILDKRRFSREKKNK